MPKQKRIATAGNESVLWRGGRGIPVEKQEDRFTVIAPTTEQIQQLRQVTGVQHIKRVSRNVYKVETTQTERDSVMAAMRSDAFRAVAHHAYKPVGSEGTIYYLTDKIVVTFAKKTTTVQIEALLVRYKLRLIKEYALSNTVLVQVTRASGANPLKIANRLAAEKIVAHAEPNLVNRHASAYTPSDGLFKRQWHLHAKRGPQLVAEASVNAPTAWDVTRGERSIVVAIIDDGSTSITLTSKVQERSYNRGTLSMATPSLLLEDRTTMARLAPESRLPRVTAEAWLVPHPVAPSCPCVSRWPKMTIRRRRSFKRLPSTLTSSLVVGVRHRCMPRSIRSSKTR